MVAATPDTPNLALYGFICLRTSVRDVYAQDYYSGNYAMNPSAYGMPSMMSPYDMYAYGMDPRFMQPSHQMVVNLSALLYLLE
jgi:hypothetical protein